MRAYVPARRGPVSKRDILIKPPVCVPENPVQVSVPFRG